MRCYDSYRQVDWATLIPQAERSLVICVYYWDKWVKQYETLLCDFLRKPETSIHFFFSSAFSEMQRLFPDHPLPELREKIKNTHLPLKQFLRTQRLPTAKLRVHHLPFPLSYAMQCVDDKLLVMSFFPMFRDAHAHADAPGILIDLSQAPNSKKFYDKEHQRLLACAEGKAFTCC